MKLVWVKINQDVLVGEIEDRSSVTAITAMKNPMMLQHINMPAPSPILNGKAPQMVTGFKFLPVPCGEISFVRVDWAGVVKKHDGVYVTYYKVLEAQEKNESSPLMVEQ